MKRHWVLGLLLCLVPFSARADGIDLPVALAVGIGFFIPLLLFNATIEAPVLARYFGMRFSQIWYPWFKANVWSLIAGIPAMFINGLLGEWLFPEDFQQRLRIYPLMLLLYVLVYFALTCLVEWLYLRRLLRSVEVKLPWKHSLKGVIYANLASYVILGPIFIFMHDWGNHGLVFSSNAQWSSNATATVVTINSKKQLESCLINGQNHRILLNGPVVDYVVSEDLSQILYSDPNGRYYLQSGTTNWALPALNFTCDSKYMDFSPSAPYAAFLDKHENQLHIVNLTTKQITIVKTESERYPNTLFWSGSEEVVFTGGHGSYSGTSATNRFVSKTTTPVPDSANHFFPIEMYSMRVGTNHLFYDFNFLHPSLHIRIDQDSMSLSDPTGFGYISQGNFLDKRGETIFQLGKTIYVVDSISKRIAPVIKGEKFTVIVPTFSKTFESD